MVVASNYEPLIGERELHLRREHARVLRSVGQDLGCARAERGQRERFITTSISSST